MSSDLSPLDDDIRALLDDVDRLEANADAAIVAQMRDRIDLALAAGATAAPLKLSATDAIPRLPKASAIRQVLAFGGTFVAGAVVALAVERLLAPSPPAAPIPVAVATIPAPAPLDQPLPSSSVPVVPPERPNERRTPIVAPRPATSPAAPRGSADEQRDDGLAAETRLVDTARVALARGEFAAALDAATTHERRFPQGRLTEEREAILIQALAGAHHDADARSRAETFRAHYPSSFFLPLVNRAVTSTP